MRLTKKRMGSTRAERKRRLRQLLEERDREQLLAWSAGEPKALRTVFAALFETDDRLRWRAVEALGWLAGAKAETDAESVRDWIRRILWNMMEESGGLMWHGPEAIGEILVNAPALIPEYVGPLGSFRIEEPFEAGTYMALARMAAIDPTSVGRIAAQLLPGLEDADPRIRAHAALALTRVGHSPAAPEIAALEGDDAHLQVYDHLRGELQETTVGAFVRSKG